MSRRISQAEMMELLGGYAVDALEPWEAEQVAEYVASDAAARREVLEHRQTLAILAAALDEGAAPPAHLWDRIAGGLADAPPPLRLVSSTDVSRARRVATWMGGLAAAAVIALVAVVGVSVLGDAGSPTVDELAASAVTSPGAEVLELSTPGEPSAVQASVTLLPGGVGYVDHELPALAADRTYQLWAIVGSEVISAGVLGPEPAVAPFQVTGEVAGLAITEEVAGGVAVSANQPVALWLRDA